MILVPVKMVLLKKEEQDSNFKLVDDLNQIHIENMSAALLDEFNYFNSISSYIDINPDGICSFQDSGLVSSHRFKVIAKENEIGLYENSPHSKYPLNEKKYFDIFSDTNKVFLKMISESNGLCHVLCIDEFSNPEEYEGVGLWDGEPKLIYNNKKVIVYPK